MIENAIEYMSAPACSSTPLVFLCERGGDAAAIRAFKDHASINEAWELPPGEFKAFLGERCREALETRRGAT